MRLQLKLCVLFSSLVLLGCPQPVTPQPDADAQAPDAPPPAPEQDAEVDEARRASCTAFCAHLALVPCPEGKDADCVPSCEKVRKYGVTDLHEACILKAGTPNAVRACGPQVGCK